MPARLEEVVRVEGHDARLWDRVNVHEWMDGRLDDRLDGGWSAAGSAGRQRHIRPHRSKHTRPSPLIPNTARHSLPRIRWFTHLVGLRHVGEDGVDHAHQHPVLERVPRVLLMCLIGLVRPHGQIDLASLPFDPIPRPTPAPFSLRLILNATAPRRWG